jgi:hypothetical protein
MFFKVLPNHCSPVPAKPQLRRNWATVARSQPALHRAITLPALDTDRALGRADPAENRALSDGDQRPPGDDGPDEHDRKPLEDASFR